MCMASMGETCNHVTKCSSNLFDQSNMCKRCQSVAAMPIPKTIEPKKIKDLDFSQNDFGQREKRESISSLNKNRFDLLKHPDLKPLSMKDFAEAINKVSPQSIFHTVPKPKVGFVSKLISTKLVQPKKCLEYLMSLICLKKGVTSRKT